MEKVVFNTGQKVVLVVMTIVALAMAYAYATGQLQEFTFNASSIVR